MDTTKINSSLNFDPQNKWPTNLPIYSWGPWQLTGFDKSHKNLLLVDLQVTGSDLCSAVHSLYPKLTLSELARFYTFKDLITLHIDWKLFFENYNLRYSENLVLVLEKLVQCPTNFQDWCSKKEIFPKDLEILRCLNISTNHVWILNAIASSTASKTMAVQILELSMEVLEMGAPFESLQHCFLHSPEHCLNEIKKIRYPMENKKFTHKQNKLKSLTSLNGVDVNWKRRGDQAGLELKFFVESEDALKKKMKSIEKWTELHGEQVWTT